MVQTANAAKSGLQKTKRENECFHVETRCSRFVDGGGEGCSSISARTASAFTCVCHSLWAIGSSVWFSLDPRKGTCQERRADALSLVVEATLLMLAAVTESSDNRGFVPG
jgi:hypothetical protein